MTKLPKLNPERSLRLWEKWGARKPPPPLPPRVYVQHVTKAEQAKKGVRKQQPTK